MNAILIPLKKVGLKLFKLQKYFMTTAQVQNRTFNLLIGGDIAPSRDNQYFASLNPSTGQVFAQLADATLEDMRKAIQCAKEAHQSGVWRTLSMAERGIYLKKLAQAIRQNAKELADLETLDVGKTTKQTTFIDVPSSAETFEYFSGLTEDILTKKYQLKDPVESTLVYEPYGVVGCVIPWNYPLIFVAWKLAPALMAGNCVILKPSPLGCVSVMRLAELIKEVGFPAGVVQILSSSRVEVSQELVRNKDVHMISFTGSTKTGQDVMRLAAETPKKVILELGGKSANIVFADCDMDAAVGGTLSSIFMNQGQMCTAMSRLLLDEKIYDQFLSKLVERTKQMKIGNAAHFDTDFGPVISSQEREKLLKVVEKALQNGAKLECGGKAVLVEGSPNGFYVEPTILSNILNKMEIAQEEVFGPILSVIKFSNEQDAVSLANDSKYGLASCIWTKDIIKAQRVSAQLQSGIVWINTYGGFYDQVPFGGYKQSGFGRELGIEGLLEYMQSKHICTDKTVGGKSLVTSWF
jgi:acyl-CoA reductase-like NAD-dependent aldehyde dehydrogenase